MPKFVITVCVTADTKQAPGDFNDPKTKGIIRSMNEFNLVLVKAGIHNRSGGLFTRTRGVQIAFADPDVDKSEITSKPYGYQSFISAFWIVTVADHGEAVKLAKGIPLKTDPGEVEVKACPADGSATRELLVGNVMKAQEEQLWSKIESSLAAELEGN